MIHDSIPLKPRFVLKFSKNGINNLLNAKRLHKVDKSRTLITKNIITRCVWLQESFIHFSNCINTLIYTIPILYILLFIQSHMRQCYISPWLFLYCRHLVQGIPAKMRAAATQFTRRINTIVFVRRAIQVFIAREVNKTSMFIYSLVVVLVIACF